MKMWSYVLTGALAVGLALSGMDAEAARRMGGGKSMGKQSSNVMQRDANPSTPAAPSAPAGQSAQAAKPMGAAPAAAAPRKPWGAMLGGLAAGLGLAWLASSLGLGAAFGNILLVALVAMLAMAALAWFMRRRAQQGAGMQRTPYAMAGAGAAYAPSPVPVATPPAYNQPSAGNAASWGAPASGGSMIGSRLQSGNVGNTSSWSIPADFDVPRFVDSAKQAFVALQAAWDKGNVGQLQSMMTDGMLREVRQQLAERDQHSGGASNHTHVAALHAQLLGIEDLGNEWLASVEFSGSIQEAPDQAAEPFREVWNMAKPKDGSAGWMVAGIQALH
ncbi:Tim44 domain-containing protein [Curvibacter sp. CHRR-16]|uniref:Tim44 domain-containing protein n=1 Tax=Curvibacter sp. CHRR-16 TaxID=2835872 RepID=UPI001BDA263C|nr:Tim44-like domain-containing protein [Curvibacter sp. CHRR-16]MBT0571091.1 Tim44 domain-containing protein [Curvibacter sp. CHRR-16]